MSPCALDHPCHFSIIAAVNNVEGQKLPWVSVRPGNGGGHGLAHADYQHFVKPQRKAGAGGFCGWCWNNLPWKLRPCVSVCKRGWDSLFWLGGWVWSGLGTIGDKGLTSSVFSLWRNGVSVVKALLTITSNVVNGFWWSQQLNHEAESTCRLWLQSRWLLGQAIFISIRKESNVHTDFIISLDITKLCQQQCAITSFNLLSF